MRKGSRIPYIYHPMEVALKVSLMTSDEEVIAAAYLHDVLEDTSCTEQELTELFGPRVTMLVLSETEDKTKSWHERKAATIEHLKAAPREVKLLALADKVCNLHATARDHLVIGDQVWERFREKRKSSHQWYFRGLLDSLSELSDEPAYQELQRLYDRVFGT